LTVGDSRFRTFAALAAGLIAAACGGSPTAPSPPPAALGVTSISPAVGSTQGGTAVTISGAGFASGVTVTIAGVPATNVVVSSSMTLSALAGPRTAGAGTGDVVVRVGSSQAQLAAAFHYLPPSTGPNAAPVVGGLVARGPRANQPVNMADLGETLGVEATVTDNDGQPGLVSYEWTATSGTISGQGAAGSWQAPAALAATPVTETLTLTVVERYIELSGSTPLNREHRVVRTAPVRVHDSPAEVRAMARQFLLDFSDSSVPVATVMANFTPTCGGTEAERIDVERNRCVFHIDASSVGETTPVVNFGGICSIGGRNRPADACAVVPVHWESTVKPGALECPLNETGFIPGTKDVADGLDQVTAVYVGGLWRLCDSDFIPNNFATSRFKK
jgi:hypothetical protein